MNDAHFAKLAAACKRQGISIWRFSDAPAEFRAFGEPEDGDGWECVLYTPARRRPGVGHPGTLGGDLSFLSGTPTGEGCLRYAGDACGWCMLFVLPDEGRVAITFGSED